MATKGKFGLRHPSLVLLRRGYMAFAAFGERVELCSLLANFVILFVPWPQRWLYKHQIDAERCVMAYRVRCGHWQMLFDAFVTGFPKSDFEYICVDGCDHLA